MDNNNINKYKILIVDAYYENLQILATTLDKKDYQISYATSGKEALSIVKMIDFDLILLDIMIPEMDGYEVCRKLRKDERSADIPVIFITAKTNHWSIIKAFEVGAQDYIKKPFNQRELLARVNTHLILKNQKNTLETEVAEKTNELKIANDRLSKLEKTKSNFLNLISYEFWKILNSITDVTESFEETELSNIQQNFITNLSYSTEKLNEFVKTLLLIIFINTQEYERNEDYVSVSELLDEVYEYIKDEAEIKEVSLNFQKLEKDISIPGDLELLKRCLLAILDNSLNLITDKDIKVSINIFSHPEDICIRIVDNGDGFSSEFLTFFEHLIENGDFGENKDKFGLGLITAKLIMDNHFGSIKLSNSNEDGQGAIIEIFLPK